MSKIEDIKFRIYNKESKEIEHWDLLELIANGSQELVETASMGAKTFNKYYKVEIIDTGFRLARERNE